MAATALIKINKILCRLSNRRFCVTSSRSNLKEENYKNDFVSNELTEHSLDSLLIHEDDIKPVDAAKKLNSLTKLLSNYNNDGELSLKEMHDHPGFKNICKILAHKCSSLSDTHLINTLRNALFMNLPSDMYLLQSLQTEVMWKARRMTLRNLTYLLNFHVEHQGSEMHEKVVKETKAIIERRWVEIDNVNDACLLLTHHRHFSKEFLHKVDDRLIELIETAKAEHFTKLFSTLSAINRRSTPALRSLAFHLCKYDEKLNVKQIVTILNSMNHLNFPDLNLLSRLLTDLLPEIKNIVKPSVISAILTAIGQMKWKNHELLESCTEWMITHADECRAKDAVSYILTCGNLNYSHENGDIIEKLNYKVTQENINSSFTWLDYVWSLVILHKANLHHISSVLIPEFANHISNETHRLKLLHVNAFAKYEMQNLKAPFLELDFKDVKIPSSQESHKLKLSIFDALSNFLPRGKYLNINRMVVDGIHIDAEFIMDKHQRPLPVNEYRHKFSYNSSPSLKSLPAGAHRVALMVWNFKDLTLNNEIRGGNALILRILKKLGYVVVQIPHFEFPVQDNILKKVQFLQKRIEEEIQVTQKKEN